MAENDDFTFEEDESVDLGAEQEPEQDDWTDYEPEKKGGSKRLLYLLLLLIVLAGFAVYKFVLSPADGPSPPVQIVKAPRKTIAAPMPKPPTEAAPVVVPAKPVPAQTEVAKKQPEKTEAAPVPKDVSVPAQPVAPAPVATAEPSPAPETTRPKLFDSKPKSAPMAAGDYTLSAGAYVLQSSVDSVVKKIRKLGYEPQVNKIQRKIEMTRLLVGVYPSNVAADKLREVKKVSSGAFSLSKGSQTAVYAGSFFVLDRARVYADTTLSSNGIKVTEETAMIDRTLQRVTFGSFADREGAAEVAKKVAGKGLEAKPAKK